MTYTVIFQNVKIKPWDWCTAVRFGHEEKNNGQDIILNLINIGDSSIEGLTYNHMVFENAGGEIVDQIRNPAHDVIIQIHNAPGSTLTLKSDLGLAGVEKPTNYEGNEIVHGKKTHVYEGDNEIKPQKMEYRITSYRCANKLTAVPQKPATCTEDGYKAHWKCDVCESLFSDKEGNKATTEEAVRIPAVLHQLTHVPAKPATCTEDGNIEHWVCTNTGCGGLFSDDQGKNPILDDVVIGKLGHKLSLVPEKPATCTEDGNIKYYICTREGCGGLFSDAQGENLITGDVVIKRLGHSLTLVPEVPATCTEDGHKAYYACANCQKLFADENATMALAKPQPIPAEGHDFGEDWQSDATQHWHACDCGERSGVAEHSFITVVDRKPGETEPGEQHEECSVCGYRKAAVSIPAVGKMDLPQTGDSSSLLRWAALLGACCAGLWCLNRRRG